MLFPRQSQRALPLATSPLPAAYWPGYAGGRRRLACGVPDSLRKT